ncbi:hypothetical protein H4I96_02135 [Botrytis cinerea]
MANQPPPLNEMEEVSKTIPFKDSMSQQEGPEMLRQRVIQTRLHPTLARSSNMMNLDNKNLHGKDFQNIASMPSRFSANYCQEQQDAAIQTCSADSTTSNMMQRSQQILEVNECPRTPSQSSEKNLKEIFYRPYPLINSNKLLASTSFSNFQEENVEERAKALLTLSPGSILHSSVDFKRAPIAHFPNNMSLDNETPADMNQQASNQPSSSSFDHQQKIYHDIHKYHSTNTFGYYSSIELNKEPLDVNASSLDQSELQVRQHEQEHSDMMWLLRAWSKVSEALYAGKVWKGMKTGQKAAFDRAIRYHAGHQELDSSSCRLQIEKFTARILFVIENLRIAAHSPLIIDLESILKEAQSFNTLSHEKCNSLVAGQRSHDTFDLVNLLERETLQKVTEDARSTQSTQPDIVNHLEKALTCKDITEKVIKQSVKHCCSDIEPEVFQERNEKQVTCECKDCAQLSRVFRIRQLTRVNTDKISGFEQNNIVPAYGRILKKNPSISKLNTDDGEQSVTENVSVKKLSPLEMVTRNPLPCWNHPVAVNGQPYGRVTSPTLFKFFNYLGFSDEDFLAQITKSLENLYVPIPFPEFFAAPKWLNNYCVLNGQVCKPLNSAPVRELLPLALWMSYPDAPLPVVPVKRCNSSECNRQSTASSPQEMEMGSKPSDKEQIPSIFSSLGLSTEVQRMMDGARQKALASKAFFTRRNDWEERESNDSRSHASLESLNKAIKASHAQIKANALSALKEIYSTTDHSASVDAPRKETICILDHARELTEERDRARVIPTRDRLANAASVGVSFRTIFQEKLNARKIKDQNLREQIDPFVQGKGLDHNRDADISHEASKTSERKWYLERKGYPQTFRETRYNAEQKNPSEIHTEGGPKGRRPNAPCLDLREHEEYRHLTSPELNEMRRIKAEFQYSIDEAYLACLAATKAKDAVYAKFEAAIAERNGLREKNFQRHDLRFEKEISDADDIVLERQIEYTKKVDILSALTEAETQRYRDREAFDEKIKAISRVRGDDITHKTEPAKNNSVCATLVADDDAIQATLAQFEAHSIALGTKKNFNHSKHRNPSISSNDYITVEEHAKGRRGNHDQPAWQAFFSHPDKVPAHDDPRLLNNNISSEPPAVTGQYPNLDSQNYCSFKGPGCAEYMTMFKDWKPKPNHADIMKAMIVGRAARRRQLAGKQPKNFDCSTFQSLRHWCYSRPDNTVDTADSMILASSALDILSVKEQDQYSEGVTDKGIAVSKNADEVPTDTSQATDTATSNMNEQVVMVNQMVAETIDTNHKLADTNVASVNEPTAIADDSVIKPTKLDDIITAQQVVNNKVNSICEATAHVEMTNIGILALSDLLISSPNRSEIITKDMMQESFVLDLPSAAPTTSLVASVSSQEVDLEDDSDLQSEGSWVMAGNADYDDITEAGGITETESVEEREDVEEWEML